MCASGVTNYAGDYHTDGVRLIRTHDIMISRLGQNMAQPVWAVYIPMHGWLAKFGDIVLSGGTMQSCNT